METAKTVEIGAELEHVWTCQNLRSNQFIFVHNCVVNPEFSLGNDPVLIDSNGCPIDETGIGQTIEYDPDGKTARCKHPAYKFADHPNLLFKCSVTVCTDLNCKFEDGTPITLVCFFRFTSVYFFTFQPLDCTHKRVHRSIDLPQNSSIELSEILQVEEPSNPSKSLDRMEPYFISTPAALCPSLIVEISLLSLSFILFTTTVILLFQNRKYSK